MQHTRPPDVEQRGYQRPGSRPWTPNQSILFKFFYTVNRFCGINKDFKYSEQKHNNFAFYLFEFHTVMSFI